MIAGLCAPLPAGAQCQLQALPVMPLSAERNDIYVGKADNIEIRFINEKKQGEVAVFPEPPLTVLHVVQGTQCEINGGIWRRNAIWLGAHGKTLMTLEYSGSNDQLLFYDTQTCRMTGTIDVSNAKYEIGNGVIQVNPVTPVGAKPRSFRLNPECNVVTSKKK
jgi:hypothetical protein